MSRSDREVALSVAQHLRGVAQQSRWRNDPQTWAKDVLGVHLWSKQVEVARSVVENKRTVVASCHGTGKALDVHTPIPTPDGFKRMGDIEPGMAVLGSDGRPVKVVATTGVHSMPRYRMHLEGPEGSYEVVSSADHRWIVLDGRSRSAAVLACQRAHVPFHSGLWHHRAREATTGQLREILKNRKDVVIPALIPSIPSRGPDWEASEVVRHMFIHRGVVSRGRASLLWMNPAPYMPQELSWIREELSSVGVKTLLTRKSMRGYSKWELAVCGDRAAHLLASPDDQAMALSGILCKEHPGWRITNISELPEGDVQCIEVDSPDHLYVCGTEMIPTHNSMIASVLTCWWVSTRPIGEAIAVSTAPSYPQVNKILWEEVRKHHSTSRKGKFPMVGRVTQGDEWKTDDGRILAFGRKPPTGNQGEHHFQGIHRRYVLVIIDEACGVSKELWTGAEAITTNEGCRILAIGNPDDRNTEFGNSFLSQKTAQDWNRISIPASSTPNFTGESVPPLLNEVLVSREWTEERKRGWGDKDPRYISKVLARFPEQSKSSLYPPWVIESSCERAPVQESGQIIRLGVDVARFGPDSNVVVSYVGPIARIEKTWTGTDTVSSAYQVLKIAEELKEHLRAPWVEIRVDAVGLGASVVDTLNARSALLTEPWFSVYEMHGSASPPVNMGGSVHGYGNARAFWFDQLLQSMRNGRVRLQEDDRFKDDLAIVFYKFKNGKLFLISKEEMRKEHGRSPDHADALAYATAPVSEDIPTGSSLTQDAEEVIRDLDDAEMISETTIAPF